jgi:AcrR family transcriptional regulator
MGQAINQNLPDKAILPAVQVWRKLVPMTDQLPGLRERKKADTRRALSDAALNLAFERGLENVTRDEIANLAGVSLRTFNNYFNGKYEALAYRQAERVRRSAEVLRQRPADEPLWASLTHAVLEPLEADFAEVHGDENRVPSRRELVEVRKLLMNSQVRNAVPQQLFDEILKLIAERTGTDPDRDMYPRLVVAVVRAVGDAAADAYVRADPPVAITDLIRDGFAAVSAGLPEPSKRKEAHHG